MKPLRTHSGVSLLELIVTITIVGILAASVMPLVRNTAIRSKEVELRRNLRVIRIAIDDYKKSFDKMPDGPLKTGSGYPKDLQELVEGRDFGDPKVGKVKFLRRKVLNPLDPKSADDEKWGWELRSYKDKPDSTKWGGEDVFDVYAPQEGTALDGSKYKEW
ncbi:type II secretion system protein [Geobacter sp. SVR]|uniref:type II secretion system protein n=1 Tax=Geobacter sp. SVR TaxID=2495594 RepID=UPI00143EFF10|nr:type II secretion system protein [Geobacter sp. SVR]BCS53670.1 type II secretion system pseudopilin PulG [Geobacter sp. SVR]GCF84133.1 type II secretion system pseudopilin PulG [Geobacter sp. SVR]